MALTKKWTGTPPEKCDICNSPVTDCFIDGKTRMGPWANMCQACFIKNGQGLGTGKGQMYRKTSVGWVKIEG